MNKLDLSVYGVEEMTNQETDSVNGGIIITLAIGVGLVMLVTGAYEAGKKYGEYLKEAEVQTANNYNYPRFA